MASFEEGATQFREDVAVNPNDTEESIWCFLCEAQLHGPEEARRRFLKSGDIPALKRKTEGLQMQEIQEQTMQIGDCDMSCTSVGATKLYNFK